MKMVRILHHSPCWRREKEILGRETSGRRRWLWLRLWCCREASLRSSSLSPLLLSPISTESDSAAAFRSVPTWGNTKILNSVGFLGSLAVCCEFDLISVLGFLGFLGAFWVLGFCLQSKGRRWERRGVLQVSATAAKKILIMGGTRFIGVFLTRLLVKEGHQVSSSLSSTSSSSSCSTSSHDHNRHHNHHRLHHDHNHHLRLHLQCLHHHDHNNHHHDNDGVFFFILSMIMIIITIIIFFNTSSLKSASSSSPS